MKEEWVELFFEDDEVSRYAISNTGRVISYAGKGNKEGRFIKGKLTGGMRILEVCFGMDGKKAIKKSYAIHRLVAMNFLDQPAPEATCVIHLDYNKENNNYTNLKWASPGDTAKHGLSSPDFKRSANGGNIKLKPSQVKIIRRLIEKGKTPQSKIAKQFGISEMQVTRIKRRENWQNVE